MVTKKGRGSPLVGIVGCLHGNETIGKEVIDLFLKKLPKGNFIFLLANQAAIERGVRYVEKDLNRCFPGNNRGKYEEKLAPEILKELKGCDFIIDIHSTTADTESFIIITKKSHTTLEVAYAFPLGKLVVMRSVSKNTAMIDHLEGISIEFARNTDPKKVKDLILACLDNLTSRTMIPKETYEVYGKLSSASLHEKLENFKLFKEEFYPILAGEKEYKGIICFKAKKINMPFPKDMAHIQNGLGE